MFSCGICETFKTSGGCFWKHVNRYYRIKNYVGHKLVIFNAILLLYCIYCWPNDETWTQEWCGMIEINKQRADTCARNEEEYCSCSFILIRIDTILSKNIWNNFQNLLFKKLLTQSGDQTDIFWKFYLSIEILWSPKTVGRVLGYTTAGIRKMRWRCYSQILL